MKISPVLAALSLALSAVPALAQVATPVAAVSGDASLTLTFEVGAETGVILLSVFNSAEAYEADTALHEARIDVAAGQRSVTFRGLPAGDYAVKSFHDVDGNGRMATNPFGMPTEPYAFSNNARGNMGPARWDRAQFTVSGATAQTISIR